jgi:hypothetical protein
MFELPVASAVINLFPSLLDEQFNDVSNLHFNSES